MEGRHVRIYGKKRNAKRFKAFDYARGVFADNLIYATFWSVDLREHVQGMVDDMNQENRDYIFEVRTV